MEKAASTRMATHGQVATYSITIQDLAAPPSAIVHLSDEVPWDLSYVSHTLTATTATFTDTASSVLLWSGVLSPAASVTVTCVVTVTETDFRVVSNTALIEVPGYQTFTRTATLLVNGRSIYLPLVLRTDG